MEDNLTPDSDIDGVQTDDNVPETEELITSDTPADTTDYSGKKLGKAAIDKMLDDLNTSELSDADKTEIQESIDKLKNLGVVTDGRGGGKSGIAHTPDMKDFVKSFHDLVKEKTIDGCFLDELGNERFPKLYMPQPKKKE